MHVDYNMQNSISEKMPIELGFEKLNGVGFKERKRKRDSRKWVFFFFYLYIYIFSCFFGLYQLKN